MAGPVRAAAPAPGARGRPGAAPLLSLRLVVDLHELELLRDRKAEFDTLGIRPIGISCDSPWTHIAWTSALDFNFPLLSDWNREATRAFGLEHTFRGFEGVCQRSAFLIDADGTVRGAWLYEITEVPDLDVVLSAARAGSS